MKLTQLAYEALRDPLPCLPPIAQQLIGANRKDFYPYIWEPMNRETFFRSDFDERASRDPHPLPAEGDRDHYFANRQIEYWVSGLSDYLKMVSVREGLGLVSTGIDYLDMGCSSGRVLRHVATQDLSSRPIGCDLNGQAIRWIHRHLPHLPAFQNTALPHLPLADASLDCVTAYSVLTHIDEFEEAWLLELHRILRPGGTALISNHGDGVWSALKPEHFLYERLKENQKRSPFKVTPEAFRQPIPDGRLAFYTGSGEANRVAMFRSNDYVREHWGLYFEILAIEPRGHLFHDLVVMRKPA